MKKLLFLLIASLGVYYVRKHFERIYDEWWEITHDKWYLPWRLAPRWLKNIWIGQTPDYEPNMNDDDLMTIEELFREMGVDDDLESDSHR